MVKQLFCVGFIKFIYEFIKTISIIQIPTPIMVLYFDFYIVLCYYLQLVKLNFYGYFKYKPYEQKKGIIEK